MGVLFWVAGGVFEFTFFALVGHVHEHALGDGAVLDGAVEFGDELDGLFGGDGAFAGGGVNLVECACRGSYGADGGIDGVFDIDIAVTVEIEIDIGVKDLPVGASDEGGDDGLGGAFVFEMTDHKPDGVEIGLVFIAKPAVDR